ncbi:MAG: type II toxin-antitoxin system Y4mF family antitoxin [Deltaproteobacteria bacterium]|nr:type II toxin-antitoxin system Y4mF family antitoxin [Deltaproteobacteria bacterium]
MVVRTPTDVGLLIRDRRRRLGLRQNDLARTVGVSRQWIVEVERGRPRAELGLVLRTLAALGIDLLVSTGEQQRDTAPAPDAAIDLDAVIAAARGRRS